MATLKAKYENEDDIPEEHRGLYSDRDGVWYIQDIEGLSTQGNVGRLESALKKSKDENKVMRNKLEAIGKDPEEVHKMTDKITELQALVDTGNKPDPEKIDALVNAKIKTLMSPVERENETLKKKNVDLEQSTNELTKVISTGKINDTLRTAGVEAKMKPGGVDDFLMHGERIFELLEVDGKERVVTKDGVGVTPGLDAKTYIIELLDGKKKDHWFEGSVGAGANGGTLLNGSITSNPWSRDDWDLDGQAKLLRGLGDEKCVKLAKSAGSSIGAATPPLKKGA